MTKVVVTPTYNERANLESFVEQVTRAAPGTDILIVDDNSPDGTGQLAVQLAGRADGRIRVLHGKTKRGLGRAYVDGFRYALELGYECIAQMDADLSHDPAYLPAMFDCLEDSDLVLGSRYLHGIAVVNWDFKRLLLSKAATRYVKTITGMPFSDATGGFKCWSRAALEAIDFDRVFSNGYLFQVEMTYKAFRKGLRVREFPIIFYERNLGTSKMDWRIINEAVWGVFRVRFRG